MFKDKKYYGEIWLKSNENVKSFCVLEVCDNQIQLETNLIDKFKVYHLDIIYGSFIGLGHLTFVNCSIKYTSSGITEARIYNPMYTFVSAFHQIDPLKLKISEFQVDNSAIVTWVRKMHWYDSIENKLEIEGEIKNCIEIPKKELNLTIVKSTSQTTNHKYFKLENIGFVNFTSKKQLTIIECIEVYNKFQKLLHFIYGKSIQFKYFSFKCLDCSNWSSLYYQDNLSKNNISNFITLDYDSIKDELPKIVTHWFSNEDISFCADIIIENLLAVKTSHSRRFTNSYSAFEAFSLKFGKTVKNSTVEKSLLEHQEIIQQITNIPYEKLKGYIKKIIRTRKFLVHRTNANDKCFTEFELLYISFLLDFVVGIGLLSQMEVSHKVINKVIGRAKSTFTDMQAVNRLLNKNILDSIQ